MSDSDDEECPELVEEVLGKVKKYRIITSAKRSFEIKTVKIGTKSQLLPFFFFFDDFPNSHCHLCLHCASF